MFHPQGARANISYYLHINSAFFFMLIEASIDIQLLDFCRHDRHEEMMRSNGWTYDV